MIHYKSTRGEDTSYTFSEVILKGIAPDGGLFVPKKIPAITREDLQNLTNKSYQERAKRIFQLFETDFTDDQIKEIVDEAYSSNFDDKKIAPLIHLKNKQYILELWHGPTAAFKDMALQIMPLFFSEAIEKNNQQRNKNNEKPLRYLILVATSGDTGKAALEGYKNKKNASVIVFYPDGQVSKLQQLQMQTQEGKNVKVFAVKGDFDDTQTLVKNIFNDKQFNDELRNTYQTVLSSANSINWGRLIPQIVYHVTSYLDLVAQKAITLGDEVDIAVPSGNFGNLLAAFYAKKMGLPIRKLICASNENNVLTHFLKTGIYSVKNRKLIMTPSPSMNILIASNIERLLHLITNNPKQVALWMNELKIHGEFEVDDATKAILQHEFFADWVTNDDCLTNIKKIFTEQHYLMDTHTSVAQIVTERYIMQNNTVTPVIVSATANWAKFTKDIAKALGIHAEQSDDEFTLIRKICSLQQTIQAPQSLISLQQKKQRFTESINADQTFVEELIKEINSVGK